MEKMVLEIWVPAAIAQIATSLISFLASTAIAAMIYKPSNGGLETSYRRIIFGLSIADIFKSFGLLAGPWFVPSSENGTWGLGSTRTCQFDGWILTVGGNAVPMYLMLLCLYYLCKLGPLKYRMTDECFYHRVEVRIHVLIVVSNIALASAALGLNTFHPAMIGSVCYYATSPRGCDIMADLVGECDTTSTPFVQFFNLAMVIWLPIISLAAIIILTTLLSCHVQKWDRSVQRQSQTPTTLRISNIARGRSHNEEGDFESIGRNIGADSASDGASEAEEDSYVNAQEGMQHLSRVYVAQHKIQARCYIGTFCLVYLPMVIGLLILRRKAKVSYSLQLLSHILYPLGGLLNILVYTRPMVIYLRREKPEYTWLQGFFIVLQSGGDLPALSACELISSKCDLVCFPWCNRHHVGGKDGLPLYIRIEEESTPISAISSHAIPSEPSDFSIPSNYSEAATNGCSLSHENSGVVNFTPDSTFKQTEAGNESENIHSIFSCPSLDPWSKAFERAKKLGDGFST